MLKNGRHLHSLGIIKKINMLNSKSLILKLTCRQKSTANRFVLISKRSIYFMGSFAFPLIWFSCTFSVWTKCYFQGNTCSFSCLVVTVYMCLNKRFDNTSELCKSKNKRFVRKKSLTPSPSSSFSNEKKMKTTPENSWVTTGMFRKRNVAKRELRYSNGLYTFVCWLHWKDLFHRSYKQLKSFMYERVNLTFYPYFRTTSARHFLVLVGWWDGFIIPFNRCRGYGVKFEHENNSNCWYPNVIKKKIRPLPPGHKIDLSSQLKDIFDKNIYRLMKIKLITLLNWRNPRESRYPLLRRQNERSEQTWF